MDGMAKANLTLLQHQVTELNAIERETDRPRARIIRRAIEEYLLRYREQNPQFAARHPRTEMDRIERELKPGLVKDIVAFRGVKREVIVTKDGWRYPTDDDYMDPLSSSFEGNSSILDKG